MKKILVSVATLLLLMDLSSQVHAQQRIGGSGSPDYHFMLNDSAFFPIGWWKYKDTDRLDAIEGNIVFMYWGHLLEEFGNPNDWNLDGYLTALNTYLDEVQDRDLLALIDVASYMTEGEHGFGLATVDRIVETCCAHPAVFGWYLANEPEGTPDEECGYNMGNGSGLRGLGHPTPDTLHLFAERIKDKERELGVHGHPIIPIISAFNYYNRWNTDTDVCTGKPFPSFDNVYTNSIVGEAFVYRDLIDNAANNEHQYLDHNILSRITTQRGMTKVKEHENYALIFAPMTTDTPMVASGGQSFDFRAMNMHDIIYESMSPVIHGARGLLYYWWHRWTDGPRECREVTLQNTNQFIRFFQSNELDKIVMLGQHFTDSVANVRLIDGFERTDPYTWRYYNNYGSEVYDEDFPEDYDWKQFNCMIRKYKGSYYLFAVNDYKPTVTVDFFLDSILEQSEQVYHISEFTVDGNLLQKNFDINNGMQSCRFSDVFSGYDVKLYKIDVISWSNTYNLEGISWGNAGGSITIADFNGNGKKDLLVMGIPEDAGEKKFRYKIGWDITANTSTNGIPSVWFGDANYHNFPPLGYGEFSGIAWTVSGGGVAACDLDRNNIPELLFMGLPEECLIDTFRIKIMWNVQADSIHARVRSDPDYSYYNFPTDWKTGNPGGRAQVKGTSNASSGSDIAVSAISSTGPLDIFLTSINDSAGQNDFRYKKITFQAASGKSGRIQVENSSTVRTANTIGWETKGAGLAIGDIDGDGTKEAIFAGIESTTNQLRFRIFNMDTNGNIEDTWRPYSILSLQTPTTLGGCGIALADLDSDGDSDMIAMGIAHTDSQRDTFKIRFGFNGLRGSPSSMSKAIGGSVSHSGKTRFVLLQNYPNPSNPNTTIMYRLPSESRVILTVFNILGQEVATLIRKTQPAGDYSVHWDGHNSVGRSVASGIYIYRIVAETPQRTYVSSKKMILLK